MEMVARVALIVSPSGVLPWDHLLNDEFRVPERGKVRNARKLIASQLCDQHGVLKLGGVISTLPGV